MKRVPFIPVCWLVCWATVVSAQQPANASSPEIGADRRVTFQLNAPKAQEVVLTGEFLKRGTPLVKDANGVWTVTVGPIEPEIYHYNFTVDGVRIIDPANPNLKTGSTASTLASVLEVRGDAPAFYDGQNVPHGEIRTHWYHSKSLSSLRRLTVYTLPRYERDLEFNRNGGDAGDLFPGSNSVTRLSDKTAPSTRANDGEPTGVTLSQIADANGAVKIRVKV